MHGERRVELVAHSVIHILRTRHRPPASRRRSRACTAARDAASAWRARNGHGVGPSSVNRCARRAVASTRVSGGASNPWPSGCHTWYAPPTTTAFRPGVDDIDADRMVDAEVRVQRVRRDTTRGTAPRRPGHRGPRRRRIGSVYAVDRDQVALLVEAVRAHLDPLDRRVDVARGAGLRRLLAEHVPRLDRVAQLERGRRRPRACRRAGSAARRTAGTPRSATATPRAARCASTSSKSRHM